MNDVTAPPRAGRWRLGRLGGAGLAAALLALGAILPAARPLPFDLCLWHRWTGLPCLGCGLTRSVCSLIQGDLAGSVAQHPAGPIVALILALVATRCAIEALRGEPLRLRSRAAS